jgi:hypothetical protein
MTKHFNTITAFTFLLLTALPVSFALCLLASQAYIKHQMKQELKYSQLETIILDSADIQWVEKDRELLINDHMFDVESMLVRPDGKIELKGLYDEAEDNLIAQLELLMQNQQSEKSTTLFAILFHQFTYENSQQPLFIVAPVNADEIAHSDTYNIFFTPVYLARHLPPPKA